jgi:hypothetical protein
MELFTVHARKDDVWIETQNMGATRAVAKANSLPKTGWDAQITDFYGRRYGPSRFHEILSFDRKPPIKF